MTSTAESRTKLAIVFTTWPGMTRNGDVHVGGDMKVAWFKVADGNILNIVSR